MTKAVIIEDEPAGVEVLTQSLARYCPDVEVVATGSSNAEALKLFDNPNNRIDVAFLDINLPDGLIFQTLKALDEIDFEIIFITAYDQYAVRAFQLAALDYLLKPLDPEELMRAVSRIKGKKPFKMGERVEVLEANQRNLNNYEKIAINALEGTHFVRLRDIVRLEGSDNYTHIHVAGEERFTASKTMKYFEDLLTPYNFFRTHKKHLINLNFIKSWNREDGGLLVLENGAKVEVARRRRPDFADAVRKLEMGAA